MIGTLIALQALAGEGSFDHTHAAFGAFLKGAVSDRGVDYGVLASRRPQLDAYLASIRDVSTEGWTPAQRLALTVNAYNALTLSVVLDAGPPKSIMDIDGGQVWKTRHFVVAGQDVTLDALENAQARKLADGRVHAVLNCASRGCPPLPPEPLSAATVDAQLDAAARRWVSANAWTLDGDQLKLSKIFDWYSADFTKENHGDLPGLEGNAENAVWFLSRFVDASTAERLKGGGLTVGWTDYDWALNLAP
ncbi:MAG: DUF547 domain-containing protein [Alphaproteobacteria bacterium]|nr:DUF547 domain-containing protein [Alphaproteobacteria bacterium]MCB9696398.1 DUF547 domain-containing protein [Alphaproteobacteria bacterium]